jgi:hypothetical protein
VKSSLQFTAANAGVAALKLVVVIVVPVVTAVADSSNIEKTMIFFHFLAVGL